MESRYFEERSKELHTALLSYAVRRMGNVQDGEDVLGDAMLIASAKAATTDITTRTEGFIANWFYKIVENTALNARRARYKITRNELPQHRTVSDANETNHRENEWDVITERGGKDFASVELLHKAKARMRFVDLTIPEREIIQMRLEGKSYAEIVAAGKSVSAGAARFTVFRVTDKLKKCKMTSEDEDEAICSDMEHLFYICANATVYHPPTSTGAALSREKLARLK